MDFQRARSKEQKDVRLDEIIKVACEEYATTKYEKISMASIAKKLPFTRGNLYSYAKTKEEIYLLVLIRDHQNWVNDLQNAFKEESSISIEEFASIWADVYASNPRLLSLYSILYSIIEQNVSLDKLTQFKITFFEISIPVLEGICQVLPQFSEEQIYSFFQTQFIYIRGLYPATIENDIQEAAISAANIPYVTPNFKDELTKFVTMILKTY